MGQREAGLSAMEFPEVSICEAESTLFMTFVVKVDVDSSASDYE